MESVISLNWVLLWTLTKHTASQLFASLQRGSIHSHIASNRPFSRRFQVDSLLAHTQITESVQSLQTAMYVITTS